MGDTTNLLEDYRPTNNLLKNLLYLILLFCILLDLTNAISYRCENNQVCRHFLSNFKFFKQYFLYNDLTKRKDLRKILQYFFKFILEF